MSKLKSVLKNKRFWIIFIIVVVAILAFAIPIFKIYDKSKNEKKSIENSYTFYIRNNGELEAKVYYRENYDECWRPFKRYICSEVESFIEDITFENTKLKELYKNVDFKELSLEDALILYFKVERNDELGDVIIASNYKLDEEIKKEIIDNAGIDIEFFYSNSVLTEETNFHTITFDTDGGSSIDSVVVANNNMLEEPEKPTKEGCTFLYWELNGQEYDFATPITEDITLTTIWKNNKPSSNNNSSNNSANNTNTNISSSSKINLNNNISITEYHIYDGTMDCFYYMFVTNLKEVFPNATITKLNNNPSQVNFWYNKDRQDDEVSLEEINEYLKNGTLKVNVSAENNFKSILNKYKSGNYKGIANVSYTENNHRFIFSYDYISFNGLNVSANGESANKEIQSALSNATKFNGPCGSASSYENKILSEELCSKYNLECGRW